MENQISKAQPQCELAIGLMEIQFQPRRCACGRQFVTSKQHVDNLCECCAVELAETLAQGDGLHDPREDGVA